MTIRVAPGTSTLLLGKQGEHLAREFAFDISRWKAEFGDGTAVLLHQRSGDAAPYPCTITQADGVVTWPVTNADNAVAGKGKAELQYIVGDTLAKSVTYRTYVAEALGEATDPPDAYETWLDSLTTLAAETQANAEDAADRANSAAASASEAAASAESAAASTSEAAASAESAAASAEAAAASEANAEKYAELAAEEAASNGYFYIEGEDGSLYYVCTDTVEDVSLEDDGSGGLEVVYGS